MNMLKTSNPENNVTIKTSAEKANSANYKAYFFIGLVFFHKSKKLTTSSLLDDCRKTAFFVNIQKEFIFTFSWISSFSSNISVLRREDLVLRML